jgi:RNA polymerase sigma-70 factor (ECF subfamily)
MELAPLIKTFRGPLVGLIASWGAPWADAVEIAQDSFAEAWLRRSSCRGDVADPEIFGRWLRGVARNRYRNWARSRRRERLRVVPLESEAVDPAASRQETELAERLESLRQAIGRLPERQRQVVLMHYLDETSVKQIAALLTVSTKTVEGRLYQARRALARILGNESNQQIGRMLLWL